MAQPQAYKKACKTAMAKRSVASSQSAPSEVIPIETEPEAVPNQTPAQNVVIFTSFDGTVREVEDLPIPLGRATALANETSAGKIWGTPAEEVACLAMQKER